VGCRAGVLWALSKKNWRASQAVPGLASAQKSVHRVGRNLGLVKEENGSMRVITARWVGLVFATLTMSTGAIAQSYYDDQACRQYADAQTAPLRAQANSQAVGGTLLGAGLGAALGAAAGGGRGAGIGAATGAIVGTGVGAANA
jgi:hypothetical protein